VRESSGFVSTKPGGAAKAKASAGFGRAEPRGDPEGRLSHWAVARRRGARSPRPGPGRFVTSRPAHPRGVPNPIEGRGAPRAHASGPERW
jgi:hypothetical protein